MKRSEMLEIIKDSLYCHLPGYKECPDFIAETVLQAIEGGNKLGVGMEPPKVKSVVIKGKDYPWGGGCTMRCNCEECNMNFLINSWEKENDCE